MSAKPDLRRGRLAAALVVLVVTLAACGSQEQGPAATVVSGGDDDGMHGAVLAEGYQVPDTPLTDTDGATYSLAADTDRPLTLAFFGYTHCPDICQVVMATIASTMTRLDPSQRELVDVVFVTTDPARDDEATLRDYLDRFDPAFIGLTGDLADITSLGDALGVYIEKGRKLPGGGYEVDHGTPVLAIDADDRVPVVWTQGTSAAQLAEDVSQLLQEDAG